MRLILAAVGALVGATLAAPGNRLFATVFGAVTGITWSELMAVRSRLDARDSERAGRRSEVRDRVAVPARPIVDEPPSPPPAPSEISPVAAQPRPSRGPTPVIHPPWVAALRRFLTGGNTLVRVGVVILFFGVAFLLRYMAEHSHIPIEVRLTGVALGSVALLAFGWRLRLRRTGYALALQGGGVGILYLTVFAALRLYAALPAAIAFPLLAVVAALSAVLAVLQNSQSFALLGVTGGFLAPVLASTGQGSHVALFSYFALLNAGILSVAWFKAWRALNLAGFLFTFAIATAWGVLRYQSGDFPTTEPFLVLFFLFYLGISILFTLRQPPRLTGYVDGALIFGTPIVAFALQSSMLHNRLMSLAWSAVAMAAVYLTAAALLQRRHRETQALLIQAFLALGVIFLTLAVPLALDARWNAATWAVEGAGLIWVGCRQNRRLPRLFGALLILASGCVLATTPELAQGWGALPWNGYFGMVLLAAAALIAARIMQAHRDHLLSFERLLPDGLFLWALAWWMAGGVAEISRYVPSHSMAATLIFVTVSTLLSSEFHRFTQIVSAEAVALAQLLWMLVTAAYAIDGIQHPFADFGWLSWPAAFLGLSVIIKRHEGPPRAALANGLHASSLWLLCGLAGWEMEWRLGQSLPGESWKSAAWSLSAGVMLFVLPKAVTRVRWPFVLHRDVYLFIAGVGLAVGLACWSLLTNATAEGDGRPLPYLPLLNPLDLAQCFVLLVLYRYWRYLRAVTSPGFARLDSRLPLPVLAALVFIWLNAVVLRTLHQWYGVPLDIDALLASTLVETSLSIFWTLLALVTMLFAARRHQRVVWMAGGALLTVVVAKLFLVDLSRVGSVERIVSFVGVGLLMLIVGYVSPMPPARQVP